MAHQDPQKIEALIKDNAELLAIWWECMVGENHWPKKDRGTGANITTSDGRGTMKAYTLDRSKREATEQFQEVVDGKQSANQAPNQGWHPQEADAGQVGGSGNQES